MRRMEEENADDCWEVSAGVPTINDVNRKQDGRSWELTDKVSNEDANSGGITEQ